MPIKRWITALFPLSSFSITLFYLLTGSIWMLISDQVLHAFADDGLYILLQVIKDWAYVVGTSAVLFALIQRLELQNEIRATATAAERTRIARELHDAVTQTLFSASLIAEVLPKIASINSAEAQRRLAELRDLTRGALAEMRSLLLELRPTALLEIPLHDLVKQLADAMHGRSRLPVTVTVDLARENDLPIEQKLVYYRVLQEALNNAVKHARATEICVSLQFESEQLTLHIIDNGRGFDSDTIYGQHFGLKIMRERAESIGAHLQIDSSPEAGTHITLTYPQMEDANHD